MLDWIKKRRATPSHDRADGDREAAGPPVAPISAKYFSLTAYVENRYANTVVLTFAEIEDLLGFALPSVARLQEAWWADALTVASRSIKANLAAQTVVFERTS